MSRASISGRICITADLEERIRARIRLNRERLEKAVAVRHDDAQARIESAIGNLEWVLTEAGLKP